MIHQLQDRFPIAWLVKRLNVARSGYYAWLQRQANPGPRATEDDEIAGAIERVFRAHRCRYGSPRIHQELREAGRHIGRKRVERLMRREGLMAKTRKRFRPCKANAGNGAVAENVLDRQFQPSEPNRCWAGDITYIRTTEGWRYLAVWIDLFSRRVVGWKRGSTLEASMVPEARERALGLREVKSEQLLIHTDRGSQYTAADYQKMLKANKITCSMSGKGNCWDNAVSESFFSTFKLELELDENSDRLLTPWELQRESAFWIEGYYNRERRHSSIDYLSPIVYEARAQRARIMSSMVA
jgi:putative transposase